MAGDLVRIDAQPGRADMPASSPARFLPILLASLSLAPVPRASAAPGDATIAWADTLLAATAADPSAVLGPPDDRAAVISEKFHSVWVRGFTSSHAYAKLATFLGVPDRELADADVIAFEQNGSAPAAGGGGWESTVWFFSDLARSYGETFDERSGVGTVANGRRAVFRTGSVSVADYGSFFGVAGTTGGPVISWLLIDLPDDIDVRSPDFSVWVGGTAGDVGLGEGTPDPDAIGLLTAEAPR
jgi:hypothetical protein